MTALAIFFRAAWGFLSKIPWPVYAVLAAAIAIWSYGHNEHRLGYKEAKAEDAQAEEVKRKAQEAADALANAQLFSEGYDAKKHAASLEYRLAEDGKAHAAQLAVAQTKETNYVSPIVLAHMPDVPLGYVLWRIDTAALANGIDFPDHPSAPAESLGDASGLSLSQISDLDLAQASAFRTAVTWGKGWQQRAHDVEQECSAIISTVKGTP